MIKICLLGCSGHHFTDVFYDADSLSYGKYPDNDQHGRLYYPRGEFIDIEWDWGWNPIDIDLPELDGGVGLLTRSPYPIEQFHEHEWLAEVNLANFRVHGFIFSRVKISSVPLINVDVYVVHLYAHSDGCDRVCRRAALKQLRNKMREYTGTSPWPVLLMGDFNIGGPPDLSDAPAGWSDIVDVFGAPRDVWLEPKPQAIDELDPGYTYVCPNPVGGCSDPMAKRIDFIFLLEDIPRVRNLPAQPEFKFDLIKEQDRGIYDRSISDHFGVWAHLRLMQRTAPLCVPELHSVEAARAALVAINSEMTRLQNRFALLVRLGRDDTPEAVALVDAMVRLDAQKRQRIAALNAADQTYETCLGADIVADTDYSESEDSCEQNLLSLEHTNAVLDLAMQGIENSARAIDDLQNDILAGEIEVLSTERAEARQALDSCVQSEIRLLDTRFGQYGGGVAEGSLSRRWTRPRPIQAIPEAKPPGVWKNPWSTRSTVDREPSG